MAILSCLIGMPILFVYLRLAGNCMTNSMKSVYWSLLCCKNNKNFSENLPLRGKSKRDRERHSRTDDILPLWMSALVLLLYFISSAFMMSGLFRMDLIDAFFFCFSALATIGLWDQSHSDLYGQSHGPDGLFVMFCTLYILIGLAILAMCFSVATENYFFSSLRCSTGENPNEDTLISEDEGS